jgi:hypothetical protein
MLDRIVVAMMVAVCAVPSHSAQPPNDDCSAATAVTGFAFGDNLDTTDATTEPGDPVLACTIGGPSQNGHSIWYSFTPPTSGFLPLGVISHEVVPS